ncbi:MAG: hypothetical protein RIR26_2522 [Pseudomonadota bacterium]
MDSNRNKGRWFKLSEAAQALGVSEITVRRKAKGGQLKAILRNGKYMVFLEEDQELGIFLGAGDQPISTTPALSRGVERRLYTAHHGATDAAASTGLTAQDELIQSLKRTVEDQQTLIASLENSIERLSRKLSLEKNSNR